MIDSEKQSFQRLSAARQLHEFLEVLFAKLDAQDVVFLVLHGYEGLPKRVENDIDILVRPTHVASFRRCVLSAAAETDWILIKNPSRFGFRTFWLKSVMAHEFVQIDAWSIIHWKSVPWVDTEAMLRARRQFGTFYVPSAAEEAGYLLVKDAIETGRIKRKYLAAITQSVREESKEVEKFLCWGFGRDAAAWLIQQARRENWNAIEKERGKLRSSALKQNIRRTPFLFLWHFCLFLLGHFISRFARPNGFFLALIGPDGSGKTTVSQVLDKRLESIFRKRVFYHGHFGLFPELKIYRNFALRLLGRKLPELPKEGVYEAHDSPIHSLARTLLYVFYYSLDYFFGHLIVSRFQAIGDLVIFDRYFYDWFVQDYYGRTPHRLMSVLKAILPQPDLVVFLSNSPEVIHRRKPELTIEQIDRQSRKCRQIIRHMPYAMTVSTEQSPEEVAREIADRIVEIMASRFRGKH